ncbi:hypothetical protein BVY03_00800 [bacterium K02(2017)]|nr:hypothetical protein BVY03_00800 [bacterium K02(2017)]
MLVKSFKFIFNLDNQMVKVEKFLLLSTLITLLSFAFLQVILRNLPPVIQEFTGSGIYWGDVFNRLLVIWIGILAATVAAQDGRHLSLEVLTKFLSDKFKQYANILVNLFVIIVTYFLTLSAYDFFRDQLEFEASDVLFEGVPKAYFSIIFPIGFGLICWRYFVRLLKNIGFLLKIYEPVENPGLTTQQP